MPWYSWALRIGKSRNIPLLVVGLLGIALVVLTETVVEPSSQRSEQKVCLQLDQGRLWNSSSLRQRRLESNTNKLPPYRQWNDSTQSIHLQSSNSSQPLSSLEILQDILHNVDLRTPLLDTQSCFFPNITATRQLAQQVKRQEIPELSFPILNVGMPKAGSSTAHTFFECIGRRSNHAQLGDIMSQLVDQHLPPIPSHRKADAYMQMDNNFGDCTYPQIQLLDEIHQQYPNATFLFLFRPIQDWIQSAHRWGTMSKRWSHCHIPGLQCTGQRQSGRSTKDCCTDANLQHWWCHHVRHIRQFVSLHPSHNLIELDLYEDGTARLLADLFDANASCWGHENANIDE